MRTVTIHAFSGIAGTRLPAAADGTVQADPGGNPRRPDIDGQAACRRCQTTGFLKLKL